MALQYPRMYDHQSTSAQQYQALIPYYTTADCDVSSLQAGVVLGQYHAITGNNTPVCGNVFAWVKSTEALSKGQLVAWAAPGTDTASTGSTTSVLNLVTGGLTVNAEVGNYVSVLGTTTSELRVIKANTASTITVSLPDIYIATQPQDADVFTTAPSSTNPVSIIRPFRVRVCSGVLQPVGVVLNNVTSGNYTPIQVMGIAQILTVGSGTATVVGVPAVPSTSGVIIGSGGTANVYTAGVAIIPQEAYAGSSRLTTCYINAIGA